MKPFTWNLVVTGISEALTTIRSRPLRALLASLAMAAAVATTAIVQTTLDGLAREARETSARAFGSDSFVITFVGCVLGITMLAAALSKYLTSELKRWEQLLLMAGALLLVAPGVVSGLIGIAVAAPVLLRQWARRGRSAQPIQA